MDNLDIIALGGNAILPVGQSGTITEQMAVTRAAMEQVVALLAAGRNVVLTHGNGPIVGNIVIRNEAVKEQIPPMPLDVCGADSQGGIGYMIQQMLRNTLHDRGIKREVVSIVTQVCVARDDPAFDHPVKPIGPYYTEERARRIGSERGWVVAADSHGQYRRVVPSPHPIDVVEKRVIAHLVTAGTIVIAAGGGGVPVVCQGGHYLGVEAVIDKDLAAALLARELDAERMIILTDIDAVYKNFGKDDAFPIRLTTLDEVRVLFDAGHFPPGSMGSKIQAAIEFLEATGSSVVICRPQDVADAVTGQLGTTIYRDSSYGD